ncbi:hypothetical protein IUY40_12345 [Flavobacterium sp. ALJ2]|uniref:hypothetical protein n=1 Tax=Flavobacterium sp. ALJ2 TaxID=2786960 RepID=UPI0018A09F7F|nr:hypothetical protein [Flavobacterium sp. ALJ2]MBF7092328.1 hypothetical protein [Flavobacterium sp. ALJ2]
MENKNKKILFIAVVGLIVGTLIKLLGYKTLGDTFLGLSTLVWLFVIIPLIYKFMNRNQKT